MRQLLSELVMAYEHGLPKTMYILMIEMGRRLSMAQENPTKLPFETDLYFDIRVPEEYG
jgi:hypothetical protein